MRCGQVAGALNSRCKDKRARGTFRLSLVITHQVGPCHKLLQYPSCFLWAHNPWVLAEPATQNRPVPCPKLVRGLTSFASTLEVRADPASWDWLPPCPNLPPEVRADPAFWDQLVTCPKMFFEVRADPVSWDQLVPCPRNSVLEVGADPDFQYQLVPCLRFALRYDLTPASDPASLGPARTLQHTNFV